MPYGQEPQEGCDGPLRRALAPLRLVPAEIPDRTVCSPTPPGSQDSRHDDAATRDRALGRPHHLPHGPDSPHHRAPRQADAP